MSLLFHIPSDLTNSIMIDFVKDIRSFVQLEIACGLQYKREFAEAIYHKGGKYSVHHSPWRSPAKRKAATDWFGRYQRTLCTTRQ